MMIPMLGTVLGAVIVLAGCAMPKMGNGGRCCFY
jgi:hypothetical protein